MKPNSSGINIHIRARAEDRDLIDRGASIRGINRSRFVLSAAREAAASAIREQSRLTVSNEEFVAILDWLDKPKSQEELSGMERLKAVKRPWA
jgi:uncharacterized protein (DUF1778 family)